MIIPDNCAYHAFDSCKGRARRGGPSCRMARYRPLGATDEPNEEYNCIKRKRKKPESDMSSRMVNLNDGN